MPGTYRQAKAAFVEYQELKPEYAELPLVFDATSLAHTLGIRTKTLWWFIWKRNYLYKCFQIPKRGKKGKTEYRSIQDPDLRLKNVQQAILGAVLSKIPMPQHVGAYVQGRSCLHTAKQHLGKGVVISCDVKDFFPSVRTCMVRRYFESIGYNHLVASLLAALVTYRNFLPQGAPTSGFIANLVAMNTFDQSIKSALGQLDPGWVYTRYSDDIDISHPESRTGEEVSEVIRIVDRCMRAAGFMMNEKKTKVDHRWRRQKVLGIIVNEKPNIPREDYLRLRGIIHNCQVQGFKSQADRARMEFPHRLVSHLEGKISYYSSFAPTPAQKLRELLSVAVATHQEELKDEVQFGKEEEAGTGTAGSTNTATAAG